MDDLFKFRIVFDMSFLMFMTFHDSSFGVPSLVKRGAFCKKPPGNIIRYDLYFYT